MNLIELAQKYSQERGKTFDSVIKEFLHYDILKLLYKSANAKSALVFQGGTALRLCYQNVRFSDDLDFSIANGKEFSIENMQKFKDDFIKLMMDKYGLDAEVKNLKENESNAQVKRWSANLIVYYGKHNQLKKRHEVHIEIATNIASYQPKHKETIEIYKEISQEIPVLVESLEEILADKVIAFGGREYLKYRDIWDIYFLTNKKDIKLDLSLLLNKMQNYKFEIDNFIIRLKEKLTNFNQADSKDLFYKELRSFLENDKFDEIVAWDFFETIKETINSLINQVISELEMYNSKQIAINSNNNFAMDDLLNNRTIFEQMDAYNKASERQSEKIDNIGDNKAKIKKPPKL